MRFVLVTPMMFWSRTLRDGSPSSRVLLYLWTLMNFAGTVAGTASLAAVPPPYPHPRSGSPCTTTTLPLRQTQAVTFIPFTPEKRSRLLSTTALLCAGGTLANILGFLAIITGDGGPRQDSVPHISHLDPTADYDVPMMRMLYCVLSTPWCGGLAGAALLGAEVALLGGGVCRWVNM
jgi:hypothetical protein